MSSFGARLKDERRARGWTVPTLSRRSGVPVSTLYEIEKGRVPREHTRMRIAKVFGLELAEIDDWDSVAA